jgi:hypothetical protein
MQYDIMTTKSLHGWVLQRVAAVLPQSLDADLGQKMCSAFKEQFCVPGTWKVGRWGAYVPAHVAQQTNKELHPVSPAVLL